MNKISRKLIDIILNGTSNEVNGVARSISVMPGDTINMEVYAKYVDPNNSSNTAALTQFLAQIAVGITHALRGNATGALTLLQRGSARVAGYPGDTRGIALVAVLEQTQALLDVVSSGGTLQPARSRLQLRIPTK